MFKVYNFMTNYIFTTTRPIKVSVCVHMYVCGLGFPSREICMPLTFKEKGNYEKF